MAQQVQAKQRELQSKLEAMLSSVEDERLRPMRKQGFLAMAKCCDLSDPSASGVLAHSWRHHRRAARRDRRRRYEPTPTPSTRRVATLGPSRPPSPTHRLPLHTTLRG